jgi:DNA replication protein DnaC
LNQKYDILAICQVLKEIAGIVRCQLEKNKNAVSLNINERNNSSLDTSSGQLLTANNSNQVNCNASNKERNDNSGNSNNDAWSRGEIIAAAGLALTAIGAVPTIAYLWEQISKKKAKKIDNAELIPQFDHLVARTQLEELQRKAQGSIEPVLHIAITGFAGTGKTVLAQNYANEYMEQHPTAKLRWYIRAEKESTRFEDYKKLARVLGIQFNEDTNIKKLSEKVNEALLKYPEFILIFDNVPSYKEIEVLLPKGNQLKGQVLLTSRRKDVLPTDKFPSQIKSDLNSGLNQEESLRLLQQLTRLSMEQEPEKSAARELTEQLGCLPLS